MLKIVVEMYVDRLIEGAWASVPVLIDQRSTPHAA
jgi:hypothetical protein